ncbi:MAG: hypothetical protein EZS28_007605 [Streblomastix strix]|uniref:Uncharacterized protein n=1 Tax=Streblomastix strix TaxID=222440 RepID=A0A5J4WP38_9EUKA|nr:MAG: hypothetical protein EZS28_007605 [Streblomastix strix]
MRQFWIQFKRCISQRYKKRVCIRWFETRSTQEAESLQAKVIVMQHLLQILNGCTLVLDCDTSRIAFKFMEITSKIDR